MNIWVISSLGLFPRRNSEEEVEFIFMLKLMAGSLSKIHKLQQYVTRITKQGKWPHFACKDMVMLGSNYNG